jgi:hypothetical protein
MRGNARWLGLRSRVESYFVAVLVVLVVLAGVGGYLTYAAHGQTQTRTETREVTSWESTGGFTHSARVVNDTAVYAEGDVLRNRTQYFRQLTPRLDGAFVYRYAASDGGNLTATASTLLAFRSVEETEGGNTTEYWRLEAPIETRRVAGLSPGEPFRVPFAVNVSAAAQRLDRVDGQFGGTPGEKELRVIARIALSGTRNGRAVESTRTYRLPLSLSSTVYRVASGDPATASGGQTERVTVPVEPGPLRAYGGPALAVVGVVAAAGLVAARRRGSLAISEREREWLAYRTARSEFDDWITAARVPEADRPGSAVAVDSLAGLVDVAIDTDCRVLEDADGTCYVFGSDRSYTYDPPRPPGEDSLPPEGAASAGPSQDGTGDPSTDGDDAPEDAGTDGRETDVVDAGE